MLGDNFDLNEKKPSGSGTTHSTLGVTIQELSGRSYAVSVNIGHVQRSSQKTVIPHQPDTQRQQVSQT